MRPNPIFAGNFKSIRKSLNITGAELGHILGVSQQQIHKYEHGLSHIPMRHVYKIANNFNIEYSVFFEDQSFNLNETELAQKIGSIQDPHLRQKILKSIKALVE